MSTANGNYFDGQTARSRRVVLEFTDDARLRLTGEGLAEEIELAHIRVSDRLGDVPRFLYLPGEAVIETPDNAVIDAVFGSGRRTGGSQLIHVLESRSWVAVVGCFALLAAIVVLGFYGPPVLARAVARRVPADIDQRIGVAALGALNPYFSESKLGPNERKRVERQLARLLADPAGPRPRIEFRSMNGGLPNAFALPGNIIVITDELVQLPALDDEIAATLAHELGHLEKRHGLQGLLRNSFAVLIVAAVTGDLSALTSFAASIPLSILTAGYSRDLEREADAYALELLRARDIPLRAFTTVLVKLDASREVLRRNSTYLSTHPDPQERSALFGALTPIEKLDVVRSAWWSRAKEAAAQFDHDAVILACSRVLEQEPTAPAYAFRAKAYNARNEFAAAHADAVKALEIDARVEDALVAQAESAFGLGKHDEAEQAARQALIRDRRNGMALMFLGMVKVAKDQIPEGEAYLTQAIEYTRDDYRSWAYRGVGRHKQNKLDSSLADYDEALRLAPHIQWVRFNRGLLRNRRRDYAGALADFSGVTDPAQQTFHFFSERGRAEHGAGKFDRAIADFNRGLAKKPDAAQHAALLTQRGMAYLASGRPANAIADFDAVIVFNPKYAFAYFERAAARRRTGRAQEALADLDRAIELGFDERSVLQSRAETQWDLGNLPGALRDLDRLLESRADPGALRLRGLIAFAQGNWERAEVDLNAYLDAAKARPEDYAEFFRLLVRRRRQVDEQLAGFTATIAAWPEGWAKSIGRYLSGQLTEEQLFDDVGKGNVPTRQERQCEAYFYAAQMSLLRGDRLAADQQLHGCLATGVTYYYEYKLARAERARLSGK